MKHFLLAALLVLAGCSENPRAPQGDVGAGLGFVPPPTVALVPLPARPLPVQVELERLLAGLGSDDGRAREIAENGLVALGGAALPRLDAMIAASDPEVAARARAAAQRIRLGEALWLADLIELNWRKVAENPLNSISPVDGLLETLRRPLGPVVADRKAWRRFLDELQFAEKYMNDPEREARIDSVMEAHPAIEDQLAALLAEIEKDPEFMDKRDRRALAEIVRIFSLGLRSADPEILYDALRPCGSWKGTQALLVLPTLADLARSHPNPETRNYARGYLHDMIAEGTDYWRGGPAEAWPGPVPHASRLAGASKDLVAWMMEFASSRDASERAWALRTAGHLGDQAIVPSVLRAFREDPAVRAHAFIALVTLAAPEARAALLDVLQHPDDPALVPALHACAHLRPAEAHDPVAAIFDTPSGKTVEHAASIALCSLALPEDLPRLARIVDGWTEKTGVLEIIPGMSAILRLHPQDSPDRRRIAARCEVLLKAESGSVQLAAAWVRESFDPRAGVRAWASLLDDFKFTEGSLQFPISWTAIGALERLTGVSFRGGEGVQTKKWQEWWEEHGGEYGEPAGSK